MFCLEAWGKDSRFQEGLVQPPKKKDVVVNPGALTEFHNPKDPFVCPNRKGLPLYSYSIRMGLEPSILFDREG